MSLPGIDISEHQLTPPPLGGYRFVFVRATFGTRYDVRYALHSSAVKASGAYLCAYHFGRSGIYAPVVDQVTKFLARTADAKLLALDLEADDYIDPDTGKRVVRTPMSNEEARSFIARVHAAGKRIGLYHSLSGFPHLGQDWDWIALWGRQAPSVPWTFWQSTGGPLDHDWFNGDESGLAHLVGLVPPDTGEDADVDAKTTAPIAFADFSAGSSAYADLASTQQVLVDWTGGRNVGVYGTAKRPKDGLLMDLVRLDLATGDADLRSLWVGDDHRTSDYRVPAEAARLDAARNALTTVATAAALGLKESA